MTLARFIKFVAGVIGSAGLVHLLVVAAAASALHGLYPHRIFNARTWPYGGAERFQLVGSFLLEHPRTQAKPLIAFAGSSVSYGYPWHERFVFSNLFAERRPASQVINASIVAADASGINDFIVCAAFRNRVRFDALIIEIPVVNTTSHLARLRKAGHPAAALTACAPGIRDAGYVLLAARRPLGIGWLGFLRNSEARETREEAATIRPVPRDYFATAADFDSIRSDYVATIATLLNNAQQVADVVYAFASPIYVGGLDEIGEDAAAVQHQLQTTIDACRSVPGVRCVESSTLWANRSYYYNLTHLSQAGHRAVADLFAAAVDQPVGASRSVVP